MIIACDEVREMGIIPEKSVFRLYVGDEWYHFCDLRKSDPNSLEGTYLPRTLSAHLKQETSFLQLNLFHEFMSHGGFCEHSRIGRRIVHYERELSEIEKQILCVDGLPENAQFSVDESNPYFEEYVRLRKESEDFFIKNHNYYEGFAYWLEHYLAKVYGLEHIFDEKKKGIQPNYLQLINVFDEFVAENGRNSLLEKMGFD